MSVDIPQPFVLDGGIDTNLGGGVDSRLSGTVGTNITGIPTTFTINIDQLPKIQLGLDPVDLSLSIKELPSMRIHLPADFRVGLSLFGIELANIRLCGQAMAINEPYKPNSCEVCGGRSADQDVPGLQRLVLGEV
jgi:hypothetical protein